MAEDKIIRVKRPYNYTLIDNRMICDVNLSAKAKGIMCYIMSLPDDWTLYASELKNHFTDGKDSIASGINELVNAGYIKKDKYRDKNGQFACSYYVYEVSQIADWYDPNRKSRCGKSDTENPQLLNTKRQITNKLISANADNLSSPTEKVCQEENTQDNKSITNNKDELINRDSGNTSFGIQINNIKQDSNINSENKDNLNSEEVLPAWALKEEPKKTRAKRSSKVKESTPHSLIKDMYIKGFKYLQNKGIINKDKIPCANSAGINKRLTELLSRFSVEQFKLVLRESLTDDYLINHDYMLMTILSEGKFTYLYNKAISNQPKPEAPKRHFEKSIYDYCPDCGTGYAFGECMVCGRKQPVRVDTSVVSKTLMRSE